MPKVKIFQRWQIAIEYTADILPVPWASKTKKSCLNKNAAFTAFI